MGPIVVHVFAHLLDESRDLPVIRRLVGDALDSYGAIPKMASATIDLVNCEPLQLSEQVGVEARQSFASLRDLEKYKLWMTPFRLSRRRFSS